MLYSPEKFPDAWNCFLRIRRTCSHFMELIGSSGPISLSIYTTSGMENPQTRDPMRFILRFCESGAPGGDDKE